MKNFLFGLIAFVAFSVLGAGAPNPVRSSAFSTNLPGATINASTSSATNFNNLDMANTTGPSAGVFFKKGAQFFHNYNPPGSDGGNIFLDGAGNFTMAVVTNSFQAARNVGIGPTALSSLTSGYFNVGIGWRALLSTTTGAGNMAIGGNSNPSNLDGYDNVSIGDDSLLLNLHSSENVAVGHLAGATLVASGVGSPTTGRNTFLGRGADVAAGAIASTLVNSTALGANSAVTKANQMVFGSGITENVFTGNFLSAGTIFANNVGGNLRMRADGTDANDVGIFAGNDGTFYLANWNITRGIRINAAGTIDTLGTGAIQTGGALGVGILAGAEKLNVNGSGRFAGTLFADNGGANFRVRADGTTANDGAVLASGGNIWFANWDADRGLKLVSDGSKEMLGTGTFRSLATSNWFSGVLRVDGEQINSGNLTVAGLVNAAHGTMTMSTGVVTVATSASTNIVQGVWNYVFTDAPVGVETNTSLVLSNAGQVFISFGGAISSNASGAGTTSIHIFTNHVECTVVRIEGLAAGATAYETGFKEFAISLPALCRVTMYVGQTAAQSVNLKNLCLNIKGAN